MADNATHRLLILRAGATDWDLADRVQGRTDLPLAPRGREAITKVIERLGHPPLAVVLSAEDEASRASAELLAEASRSKVVLVPSLAERSLGLWEGVLRAELEDRFCRAGKRWGENPSCVTPPEGESSDEFAERVISGLKRAMTRVKAKGSRRSSLGPPMVGVVLRPIAEAVVRCSLAGLPATEIATILRDRPDPLWLDVDVEADWSMPLQAKVTRTTEAASAA
ncbi:MAG: histidine phosphatase family protein [Phycisphaerales bacterium]